MISPQAPKSVHELAEERARARADRDFARADELREQILDEGWEVVDRADGFDLAPKPPFEAFARFDDLRLQISAPLVLVVLVDGWPLDVERCISGLATHAPDKSKILAIDCGNVDDAGLVLEELRTECAEMLEVVHLSGMLDQYGWGSLVETALEVVDSPVVGLLDVSTVVTGPALEPLLEALQDPSVVATGWKGVNVDDSWLTWSDAGPGDVDAVLGYLMLVDGPAAKACGPDVKARFYRNADMDWCLRLREGGRRIVVPSTALLVEQGRHHGYHDSDPEYRDQQSKKNYDRMLSRFRGRSDLLAPR